MNAADLAQVLAIAESLSEAPRWPRWTYLKAITPESTPRRIALVVAESEAGPGRALSWALPLPVFCPLRPSWKPSPSPQRASGKVLAGEFFTPWPPSSRPRAHVSFSLRCGPRTGRRWPFTVRSVSFKPVYGRAIMQIQQKMQSSWAFSSPDPQCQPRLAFVVLSLDSQPEWLLAGQPLRLKSTVFHYRRCFCRLPTLPWRRYMLMF